MKTVDKFGHYRGFESKAGPPGIGFALDEEGNYSMMEKRLTHVGNGEMEGDGVNMHQLHFGVVKGLEIFAKDVLGPRLQDALTAYTTTTVSPLQERLKQLEKKVEDVENLMNTIKADLSGELKSLADVTRAYVYNVTGPTYRRNKATDELKLRQNYRSDNTNQWRHIYPEVIKYGPANQGGRSANPKSRNVWSFIEPETK